MTTQLADRCSWVLDSGAVAELLTALEFRARTIEYVLQSIRAVNNSSRRSEFLGFCASWREVNAQQAAEQFPVEWQMLAVVSAFPETIQKHEERGIPRKITRDTLFDFDRRMEESYERFGEWKFRGFAWLRNHVSGNLFQLGRLQYIPGALGYPYRVYRDRSSREVTALSQPGVFCSAGGWPSYESTSDTAFETVLHETEDGIIGNPTREDGSIAETPVRLAPGSSCLFDEYSTVVHIHIPWGDKLTREGCVQSLKMAKEFYARYFPEQSFPAFRTATWLLDRELGKVLPATSNIVSFGRLFHPLASRVGNDNQLLERVFNAGSWQECKATNSLQKSILEHHRSGGKFRLTAGFILFDDVEKL